MYKDQGLTIGRYRCVSINEHDKCLSGEKGEIWMASGTTCKAFVSTINFEKIITFPIKDLEKWVLKLKVPPRPQDQLRWSNNPNARIS